MLPVTYQYLGSKTGTPSFDIEISFVAADGTTHKPTDVIVVAPNDVVDINEMYAGATQTGNPVIAIPSANAEAGTWAISYDLGVSEFFEAE